MGFRWVTTCLKCQITINLVPFWLFMIFCRIRVVITKVKFSRDLGTGTASLCVWQASLQMADLDISLCVWIWRWFLLCLLNKDDIWMSGLLVPPNHRNGGEHWMWTIYPSWGKPHTHFITNMRDPTFILVTHFTPKIKLITFLNKQVKFNLWDWRSLHHTQNRKCQDDFNTFLAWWKYNKHNPFTQNT